ncbi:MAG: UbiX family flavin prenyltransferase [Thermoplasmatota archaeon]
MKILLAITGASGVIYGKRTLEVLSKKKDVQVDLIVSESAKKLIKMELDTSYKDIVSMARESFDQNEIEASPASGSSLYDIMLIVPCSLSTLSKISSGIADNLITRSAAVLLKEGRKIVLVPRETPLSTVYLENMRRLSSQGCIILPAMPGFYSKPKNIDDLIDFIVGKILDNIGIKNDLYKRWCV